MQLTHLLTLLTAFSLSGSALAKATIGAACEGSGYDCTEDFGAVAVCNGSRWQLSADCGAGLCVWPAGDAAPWNRNAWMLELTKCSYIEEQEESEMAVAHVSRAG
ncbi:uncharacterized protein BDV17DRAFT_294217 [Aspergillus undulatus]|uniref:uncharacterized protein n=1 Tax=Aspergillus undulatus TaxID=1810928 RepID=UPI003CCD3081